MFNNFDQIIFVNLLIFYMLRYKVGESIIGGLQDCQIVYASHLF